MDQKYFVLFKYTAERGAPTARLRVNRSSRARSQVPSRTNPSSAVHGGWVRLSHLRMRDPLRRLLHAGDGPRPAGGVSAANQYTPEARSAAGAGREQTTGEIPRNPVLSTPMPPMRSAAPSPLPTVAEPLPRPTPTHHLEKRPSPVSCPSAPSSSPAGRPTARACTPIERGTIVRCAIDARAWSHWVRRETARTCTHRLGNVTNMPPPMLPSPTAPSVTRGYGC